MPAAANQNPAPNQSSILDTTRVKSTIPKAGSDDGSWVYPSPQMVRLTSAELSSATEHYMLSGQRAETLLSVTSFQFFVNKTLNLTNSIRNRKSNSILSFQWTVLERSSAKR
jgi:Cytochrome c/c1 heme lyase